MDPSIIGVDRQQAWSVVRSKKRPAVCGKIAKSQESEVGSLMEAIAGVYECLKWSRGAPRC